MGTARRVISGILLAVLLSTISMWRTNTLPDLSGVTEAIRYSAARIGDVVDAIERANPGFAVRPIDRSDLSDGEKLYPEYALIKQPDADIEEAFYQGLFEMQEEIDLTALGTSMTKQDVEAVMASIRFSHPELFYTASFYQVTMSGAGIVKSVNPEYLYPREDVLVMRETYESELDAIVAGVELSWSDFDKALYLHDYFVRNYKYDHSFQIRDAYNFFTQRTGVCQAYMLAMIAAGERVGLEVLPVTSNEMLHAWNLVRVDGEWYHVDVTWDDADGLASKVSYRYFLQSDVGIRTIDKDATQAHTKWETSAAATSEIYDNALYRYATSPICKLGTTYYGVFEVEPNEIKSIYGAIFAGETVLDMKPVKEISAKWITDSGYYRACYSDILPNGEKLVYNTQNALYEYDPASGKVRMIGIVSGVFSPNGIYGILEIRENKVTMIVAGNPNAPAAECREVTYTIQ